MAGLLFTLHRNRMHALIVLPRAVNGDSEHTRHAQQYNSRPNTGRTRHLLISSQQKERTPGAGGAIYSIINEHMVASFHWTHSTINKTTCHNVIMIPALGVVYIAVISAFID